LPGSPTPLSVGSNGSFESGVPISIDWMKGEGWWKPQQIHFRVLAQPNRLNNTNYLDSIQLPPEAESLHVGGDPMTVGPLKIQYSVLLLALLALLALGILVGGVWFMARRVLPGLWIW